MKRFIGFLLGLLMVASSFGETIPLLRCTSLAGNSVSLPEDLHGHSAVLVIGFDRDAQGPVRDWGRRLAADYGGSTTVGYYELAMLSEVPRVMRGLVVRALKKNVSVQGQARFLPVSDHLAEWRHLAHYDGTQAAYVVLVDGSGTVRWTTSGPPTEAALSALKKQLAP